MTTYITPSLGAQVILTNPTDRIADLVRTYAHSPRSASNTLYDMVISLQDTLSRYSESDDSNAVVAPITTELTTALQRCFPNADMVSVSVTVAESDEVSGAMDVTIKPTVVINGLPYTINTTTPVVNGTIVLSNDTVPS